MDFKSKKLDLEDFVCLITRWNAVLHEQQSPLDSNAAELSESQLQIVDDKKSDIDHIKNIMNIPLHGSAYTICKDLAKVAILLKISHVSFSTISEVLLGLTDVKMTAKRVSRNLKKDRKAVEVLFKDVQCYVVNMETEVLKELEDVSNILKEPIMNENPSDQESELIAQKKITKYLEGARAYYLELQESEVFSLCPKETAEAVTSSHGIGPLPHSGLFSLSMIIKEEELNQESTISALMDLYGGQSFCSMPSDRLI